MPYKKTSTHELSLRDRISTTATTLKKICLLLALTFSIYTSNAQGGFKLFFEKVYLHLDRTYYASNDDIWFKAYLVNAQSNYSTTSSNNLYVELIDPNNQLAAREVIRIDNGVGAGDFKLDDSIPGGHYRLRAYTNWMRNFGTHFVFEKDLWIASVLPGGTESPHLARKGGGATSTGAHGGLYNIQFLPEGGFMVEGLSTMVAFRAADINGNGVETSGSIVSSTGDTAVRFTTNWLGMGRFAFTPQAGIQYKAIVQYQNRGRVEETFPAAYADGFVMNINNSDTGVITVKINTNALTLTRHYGEVTLAGRHGGLLYYKEKLHLNDGRAVVSIPKKNFPGGIAAITLYDDKLRPNCERLVYIVKNEPLHISISADKASYEPKERTTLQISITDAQQQPVKATFSLAAVDGGIVKAPTDDIQSFLLLSSELAGMVEDAAHYFDAANSHRLEQLDLLLSTQGWRSFVWRQMADTSIHISYLPEAGITISGRVRELFINKPLANMNITLLAAGARGNRLLSARTDSAGRYYVDGVQLYGNQTIKINSKNNKGKKGGWIFMDTLFNNPLPVYETPLYAVDTIGGLKAYASEALKRLSQTRKDRTLLQEVIVTNNKPTVLRDGNAYTDFGYPKYDFTIEKKDLKFETLENFLIHNIPGAVADVENEGVNFVANGKLVKPRIIVDKKEDVFERIDYYQLHMEQVISVSVRHVVGHPSFNRSDTGGRTDLGAGISDVFLVYLSLKPGAYNTDMAMIETDVTGYYDARVFYAPVHSPNEGLTKPDMRTTIHWEPMLVTDENGKATVSFYNAEPQTSVRVTVEGLSDKGVPLAGTTQYMVK